MSDTEGEAENLPEDTETEERTTEYGTDTTDYVGEEEESDQGSIYDPEDFISGPNISENGTLNLDILEFDFSYGYDCRKYFNLTVLDENTVVFASGNFINFLNVETKEITLRRSALGGGIGHIRKNGNPEYPYFAVAESGSTPIIILYVWPTMNIVCVLRGGAGKTYTNMDFNPDGDLLVSQSGEPDYLITIWDWQHHTILLRTKSYVNDVFRVKFSPYVAGQLTTCGIAHIKFWKMASTFTGLKLKGEIGRFGKTEYSDIIGVLPMPDAKVVSGSSWGNILVWDDGLITFEVFRSLRRKCHDGPIVQFYYLDGELWTVSMDGHVKVWWFEKIDQADPPDDDRVILVDPTYDFYTPGVKLIAIEKRKSGDVSDTLWYAQDGNGGIWLIDLNTEEEPKESERLFVCHGGKVNGLAACPYGPYIATLGELGTFYLYDYVTKRRVLDHTFPSPGACLIWLPLEIDRTGEILLAGFGDGQVRVCCLKISRTFQPEEDEIVLYISQVIKPHNKPITTMSINPQGTLLVTAGEDSTIFIFKMDIESHRNLLTPIGFFPTTDLVTYITWHNKIENEVVLGCYHGHIMQIQLPTEKQIYTDVSYRLDLEPQRNRFTTYKSQIKRDIKIQEIEERKAQKVAKKRVEMEQIKKDNPGLEIDEETFLADSDTEEELEPLFIPEESNKIIWLKYTSNNTIWLSMAGYDAGYIYEYRIDQKDTVPLRFRLIDGGDDMEINTYVYTHNKEYLIFAMEDGSIRINKINPNDYTDLTNYFTIAMHDNQNGFIPKLCFSYDEKYFFSCGHDGNIFSYKFNPRNYKFPYISTGEYREDHVCTSVPDTETDKKLSLEEVKIKAEDDKIQKLANEHKNKIRDILKSLKDRYKKLLLRNSKLLPSQIIPRDELEPDQRVADYVDQIFADKIDIVKKKLAYDVEKSKIQVTKLQEFELGRLSKQIETARRQYNYHRVDSNLGLEVKYQSLHIMNILMPINTRDRHTVVVQGINNPDCAIMTVRQRIMPEIFYKMFDVIEQKLKEEEGKGRYFTSPCDRHTVVVQGINNPDCAIMTVRQRIMPEIFYKMFDVIEQKLKEEEGKGRPPERAQIVQKQMVSRLDKSESPLEFFLLSLTPSVIQYRLGPKLTRLLKKYRKRRIKWEKRAREWEDFLAKKPIPGKNHPDDEKFLSEAKISLGDYKLKEGSHYSVPLEQRETTVKHYKKLLETRGKQYKLRHNFVQTVFNIRDYKYELIEKLQEKQRKIEIINTELPEEFRKSGPPIPTLDTAEFPEEKLQVKVVLPEKEADLEESEDIHKVIFVEKPMGDAVEKELLSRKAYPKYQDGFFRSAVPNDEVLRVAEMSFTELSSHSENADTPYESCLRANRINRLLFYQRLTISEMQDMINDFNNWIYQARKQRLPILIRGNFIDIFIVCLNEELQILKSCEEQEDKLSQTVNNRLSAVHDMEDTLDSFKADKENQGTKLENLKLEEGKIQEKFKIAVENNKFYDFLKKVFKKKFKPPKIKTDDESSSSSSSSSDESEYEDDSGSIDSNDFGFIKQDLNVCPKGCEPALFNFTVDLRSKRHEIEQSEKEELRILEMTKKEIDLSTRKLSILKRSYGESEEKLEIYRREKQQKLNNVRCTVVLNLDQIYGEISPNGLNISDFLVFSRSKLSDLYKRVVLLHQDALDEQGKHDTYLKHLIRMKKDVIYMQRKSHFLKKEIVRLLKVKFGKEVDINELEMAILQRSFQKNYVNELEEVVLKKLVYDLRIKMTDIRGIFIHELKRWQRKIVKSQHELAREIKENTKRLELLAVISKEKKELAKFVDSQDKKRERVEYMEVIHRGFIKDLQKLENIADEQSRTLQDLKEEIMMLKTKGMAQEVRKRGDRMKESERMRAEQETKVDYEEETKQWVDYDQYVSETEEEEEIEEKDQIKKDITIPVYYSTESEDLVRELIENLMKDVDEDLARKSNESIVRSILSNILKCTSIHDYIKEIIDNLPIDELTDEQRDSVELTAEKLISLEEPQISDENLMSYVKDILEETLSEVLCHDPHYLIPTVLERLLDNLPLDFIATELALDEIALTIQSSVQDLELDQDELRKSIDRLPSAERQEIVEIIKAILERVYGSGMDFLYVIPN